ncbi:MAG: hypothetical protein FD138_44 [Planctomycetota bacterium]|nr:MAG: hypothetical protein FD138_44 [Planctomycetota bacterium]
MTDTLRIVTVLSLLCCMLVCAGMARRRRWPFGSPWEQTVTLRFARLFAAVVEFVSTFIVGWLNVRAWHLTRVMLLWTATGGLLILTSVCISKSPAEGTDVERFILIFALVFSIIAWWQVWQLWRASLAVTRMASEPSHESVIRVVRFGPAVIDELCNIFEHTDDINARTAIVEALRQIGRESEGVLKTFHRAAHSKDALLVQTAKQALCDVYGDDSIPDKSPDGLSWL